MQKIISSFRSSLSNANIDFMKMHKIALALSIISILVSLILIAVKGLNFGIDFAGGVLVEVRIDGKEATVSKVRELLGAEIKDVQIQNVDNDGLLIRVSKSEEEQAKIVEKIQDILANNFANIEYRKIDYVGPQVGSELIWKGCLALLLSFAFIMIYIWIRFDWQFGFGGIFALLHDAVITLGFFAVSGLEFNLTSIAAILTVIGYSINDSVVIYDRIRENLRRYKKMELSTLINSSINSTLSRTVITSGVTLVSILALIIYGGDVLRSFSIATFFGIVVGTYSSIYISAPILLYFDPRKNKEE